MVFTDGDHDEGSATVSSETLTASMTKWYDTSIFYLYKADFLRIQNLKTVQAIAILGIVFNNVGEFTFHRVLWSVAIQIGKILKLDNELDLISRQPVEREVCRRLLWTLIICEW